jgi:hypothetical protein
VTVEKGWINTEITIKGEPKEIAALVLAVQEQQNKIFVPSDSGYPGRCNPSGGDGIRYYPIGGGGDGGTGRSA